MITVQYTSLALADAGVPGVVQVVEPLSTGPTSEVVLVRLAGGRSVVLKAFDQGHAWKAAKEAHVYRLLAEVD